MADQYRSFSLKCMMWNALHELVLSSRRLASLA